jgi:hypothetical protein
MVSFSFLGERQIYVKSDEMVLKESGEDYGVRRYIRSQCALK